MATAEREASGTAKSGSRKRAFGPRDCLATGPGTLAGRYMRLFWQPVYLGRNLKAGRAIPLRIMSEDYTLYRGEDGVAHILAPRCAHRCTQLSTGWVEGATLRCFYHGWRYDASGQCVEAPAEREGFADTVRIRSYPTEEYLGLIFAYLGDGEPPPLPRYSEFEKEGVLTTSTYVRDCNCYNNLESNMDSLHTAFVHRTSPLATAGLKGLPEISGEETEYGILKLGTRPDGEIRYAPFYWPNALHIKSSPGEEDPDVWADHLAWRVPIDDVSHVSLMTNHVGLTGDKAERYLARQERARARRAQFTDTREVAQAVLRGEVHVDELTDRPDIVNIQDYVAQVGQGPMPDFEGERLGRSDVLVALYRQIWARELQAFAERRPLKQWRRPEGVTATTGVAG